MPEGDIATNVRKVHFPKSALFRLAHIEKERFSKSAPFRLAHIGKGHFSKSALFRLVQKTSSELCQTRKN